MRKGSMTRILAIDASLNCPGFAVLEFGPKKKAYLLCTCSVDNKKNANANVKYRKSTPQKLQEIGQVFHHLMATYQPDIVVRERGFSRYAASTQQVFRVVGVLDLIAYDSFGKIIEEIPPTAVKLTIARKGSASKEEVAASLSRYVGKQIYKTDDESDAVAVGLTCAIEHDLCNRYTVDSHAYGFGPFKHRRKRRLRPQPKRVSIRQTKNLAGSTEYTAGDPLLEVDPPKRRRGRTKKK